MSMCKVLRACPAHSICYLIAAGCCNRYSHSSLGCDFTGSDKRSIFLELFGERSAEGEGGLCSLFAPPPFWLSALPPLRFSDAGEEDVAVSLLLGSGADHCANSSVLHPAFPAPQERLRRVGFPP